MIDLRGLSFGGTAALVTSMGLVVGFDAVTAAKSTIISGLFIVGLADNLTDSLSVHVYQESERLPEKEAFRTTVTNFIARFGISLSFVAIFVFAPASAAVFLCIAWGFTLLSCLSYFLARARAVSPSLEIVKHTAVAMLVIVISKIIGWALVVANAA